MSDWPEDWKSELTIIMALHLCWAVPIGLMFWI